MASKKKNRKRPAPGRRPRGSSRPGPAGGMGGADMQQLMRQAQQLQEEMSKTQDEISDKTFTYTAGGEMISVVVSGEKELLELNIKPEVIDPEDPELLSDLIMAAINGAFNEVDEYSESQMSQFDLPGGMI